jgi:ankyrin repeat protein
VRMWAVGACIANSRANCSARVSSASALESPKQTRERVTQSTPCLHRTAPPASLTRALALAVAYAPVATITRLLDAGVSVSCVALVQTLLISGSILGGPVSVQSGPLLCDCPLTAAARLHRGDVVRMLLDRGADPRWTSPLDRATPLHHALGGSAQPQSSAALDESSAEARLSVVTALLESGCDVNAKTRGPDASSALHLAARCRDHAVVAALLSANADVGAVDASGMVPLHVAVTTGCAATVSALLAGGADVNCMWADKDMSSVMLSAIDGSVDVLNTLLAAGGSVQVPGTGVTLLHAVCAFGQKNRPEVAALLIAHDNSLLNAVDDAGETCLHIAAKSGRVDVLRALIARGASVGVSNLAGETAAHAAAKGGRIAACLLLAEKCPALLTMVDGAGHTPEVVADLRGHAELASALASIAERGNKRGRENGGADGGGGKLKKQR